MKGACSASSRARAGLRARGVSSRSQRHTFFTGSVMAHALRTIPPPHGLAPQAPEMVGTARSSEVLPAANAAAMVGVMHQIGLLAQHAHEIFAGLTVEVGSGVERVGGLHARVASASERLARVDDALRAADEFELTNICTAAPGMEFHVSPQEESGLFLASTRPHARARTMLWTGRKPLLLSRRMMLPPPRSSAGHAHAIR